MRKLLSFALAMFVLEHTLVAQDWPQWRGPARDGSVPAASVPASWPDTFARAWQVDIGEGYSSPVLAGGRIYTHSRRDPNETVTAIDAVTGKTLWQHNYDAAFTKNSYASKMAKGPHATPLVTGGRLFTLGGAGKLMAWEAETGRYLWAKDFAPLVDTSKLFCGTAASPLLVGGRLIVQVGSDVHGGQIVALDPATGMTTWIWRGPGPGYASPVVAALEGTSQIVTMTNRSLVGVDAATGVELWTVAFPDEWHENIVTPIWTGAELIVSGIRQGTQAYRLGRSGGRWEATPIWKNTEVAMYMSSPVYADGIVYGLSTRRRGQFVAFDAKTGATRWATEGREAEHASTLLTTKHVVFLTNTGSLIVARRGTATFDVEKKYALGESETWAMPVLMGRDLIVRDAGRVVRMNGK